MYKQIVFPSTNTIIAILRLFDMAGISLDIGNCDYIQMKKDLANGATLQDATGTPMTATQIQTFLQGLK